MPIATRRKTEKESPPIMEVEPSPELLPEQQAPTRKVTALIFSYDNAPGLRRCLTALENSNDRQSMEILVVDSGSHDESPGMDSEFPNITILRLPRYFGRTRALNIGTRTSTTENLFFLTPEVEVMPTTIPALLSQLESDADIAAVCPLLVDTQGQVARQFFRFPTPATGIEVNAVAVAPSTEPVTVEYASFQTLMVRKYFFKGINYLDQRYGDFGADAELGWQIRRASKKTVVLPQVAVLFTPVTPQYSSAARTTLEADRIHGIAVFFGKHYGFMSGLLFRIKEILKALLSLRLSLFMALISGSKIDGSQSAIL